MKAPPGPWPPGPIGPELGSAEVHVWVADLDAAHAWPPEVLSADERERAGRLRGAHLRRRYVAAHGFLRDTLSRYLGMPAGAIRFRRGPHGKPFLDPSMGDVPPSFNLSHSQGKALLALSRGRRVGVDVELLPAEPVADSVFEYALSPSEIRLLKDLPAEIQTRTFYRCWTLKEAYVKAEGRGLSLPLDQIEVSPASEEPVRLLRTGWDPKEPGRWTLAELAPSAPYVAGLAVEGPGISLRCWTWRPRSGGACAAVTRS